MTLIRSKLILSLTVILFFCLLTSAYSENVRITVISSYDSAPYREALEGFKSHIQKQGVKADFDVYTLNDDIIMAERALKEAKKSKANLIFTLGTLATDVAIEKNRDIPIIAGLVLNFDKIKSSGNATGVILKFPVETQFKMLNRFLPSAKTIGVIYNSKENKDIIETASKVAKNMGLNLYAQEISSPRELPKAFDNLVKNADALWGIADSLALTSETAKQILLFSYRNRIPFVGLSSSWVKAGALYSLDRDYADIGIQCSEMAIRILNGSDTVSIPPTFPRKVLYSINLKTARYMKVQIPESLINGAYQVFHD